MHAPSNEDPDVLRILVATDCHLGYMEKDEIRRDDSFNSFEEICKIAQGKNVDFILLGGDLFHENKPSRSTLVRTIEILRRYCLNDRPVQFQVVSDQTINFSNAFGHVNYEDPNFNVGLPVFTIHGNHDDPAGVDNLSAIDILSSCNLVNYFGKTVLGGAGVGQITLNPVLIQKGNTRVALYGLGNIRDERLNRMFQTPHAVQWMRPASQENCHVSDWFNLFVLHQNRVKSNPKNAISEHFLARFLDLVIWGHEHECIVEPQEVAGIGFHVTQPGSSIATSLIDGEAKPKHVLLLEIKDKKYRPNPIPLSTVRPFEFGEVILRNEEIANRHDPNSIIQLLDSRVNELIAQARAKNVKNSKSMIPLIRLRVDYTGYSTINPQRFGQKFVGKVANPHDILLFSKAAKKKTNASTGVVDESELIRPEELNQQNIEALLNDSNLKMNIVPVQDLGYALHDFVNKDEKLAFHNCLKYSLQETQEVLKKDANDNGDASFNEDYIMEKLQQEMQKKQLQQEIHMKPITKVRKSKDSVITNNNHDDDGNDVDFGSVGGDFVMGDASPSHAKTSIPSSSAKGSFSTKSKITFAGVDSLDNEYENEEEKKDEVQIKQRKIGGNRVATRKNIASKANILSLSSTRSDANDDTDHDNDNLNNINNYDDDYEEQETINVGKRRGRGRGRGRDKGRGRGRGIGQTLPSPSTLSSLKQSSLHFPPLQRDKPIASSAAYDEKSFNKISDDDNDEDNESDIAKGNNAYSTNDGNAIDDAAILNRVDFVPESDDDTQARNNRRGAMTRKRPLRKMLTSIDQAPPRDSAINDSRTRVVGRKCLPSRTGLSQLMERTSPKGSATKRRRDFGTYNSGSVTPVPHFISDDEDDDDEDDEGNGDKKLSKTGLAVKWGFPK